MGKATLEVTKMSPHSVMNKPFLMRHIFGESGQTENVDASEPAVTEVEG